MKLALVGAAAVLLCHRGELMSQYLPLGRCIRAYWRQTPWHTGGHLLKETSWGLSHNSDTLGRTERKQESSKRCKEAEEERSKNRGHNGRREDMVGVRKLLSMAIWRALLNLAE